MRSTTFALSLVFVLGATAVSQAQLPIPVPGGGNLQRLPDDQIEGTIFEYKCSLKEKPKAGEEIAPLEGKFRIEDNAILDVSPTFKLPSKEEVQKLGKKLAEGKGGDVKLPAGTQQKRLGQYHNISKGKMRLDFDDKESLHGTMILTHQKKTDDVWIGTYTEKDGKKVVRTWQVEVRPIED